MSQTTKTKKKKRYVRRTLEEVCPNCETEIMHWVHYAEADEIPTFPPSFEAPVYNRKINNRIFIHDGSIVDVEADVVVVSTNKSLKPGGMAIVFKMAGDELKKELGKYSLQQFGNVVETPGFDLPADHIFFAVVPTSFESGESHENLRLCYENSLNKMVEKGYRSIAFPCLGTGGNMINKDSAAKVALKTIRNFLERNVDKVDIVIFCRFSEEDKEIYDKYLHYFFPTTSAHS